MGIKPPGYRSADDPLAQELSRLIKAETEAMHDMLMALRPRYVPKRPELYR